MNGTKITVTFEGGKRRVLNAPDTLPTIDARRAAYFVFNNLQVYTGHSDGEVDEDGDFCITAGGSLVARGGHWPAIRPTYRLGLCEPQKS